MARLISYHVFWLRMTVASLLVAGLIGCSNGDAPLKTPEQTSAEALPQQSELTSDLVSIPGVGPSDFDGKLSAIIERVDPSEDEGWDTEVFGSEVQQQLHHIAEIIRRPDRMGEGDTSKLVTADFASTALRPEGLQIVFSDGAVQILRVADNRQPPAISKDRKLKQRLLELALPFAQAGEIRVKFKTFRVAKRGAEVSTTSYYNASGRTPLGTVQQNAQWHCLWSTSADRSPPRLIEIRVSDYEEIVPRSSGGLQFVDWTEAVLGSTDSFRRQLTRGIDHWRGRLQADFGVDTNGLQGIAVGDVNGDGRDDLYVLQQGGLPNRLYVQNADGTLRDESQAAGVDWLELNRAALLVDLDNDGDQDLAISQGWYVMLMENDGTGRFTKRVELRSEAHLYSLAAADYDNDADLDLFFCGRNPSRERSAPEGILGTPIPYHDANNGGPNLLLRNEGGWQFRDVTKQVGLDVNNRRYSYAASWEDFDNDGDQDLYVANDFGRNNLYRNDVSTSGRFTDVAAELGVEDISAGMSVTWGDYNRDGRMDVYVSNMFSSAGNRITYQRRFGENLSAGTQAAFQRHARGNSLFENQSPQGRFSDVSAAAGVTMGRWAWGAKFVDLNNDGWEDLYVANGFLTTEDTGDL